MARPKKPDKIINPKTYTERFTSFKNGKCPYCGAGGATIEENKRGHRGHCISCGAENNFTKPDNVKKAEG